MDIEFTQFQISTMEQYIPDKLNYILVFQMPWVLNGELPAAKVKWQKMTNCTQLVLNIK